MEPALVGPADVELALVEPAELEPAPVEPAELEPALVEPALVKPAERKQLQPTTPTSKAKRPANTSQLS